MHNRVLIKVCLLYAPWLGSRCSHQRSLFFMIASNDLIGNIHALLDRIGRAKQSYAIILMTHAVREISKFLMLSSVQAKLFNASPVSLASNRVIAEPYDGVEQNILTKTLLKIGGFYSTESKNLRAAKAWYECVTEQVDDSRILPGQQIEAWYSPHQLIFGV